MQENSRRVETVDEIARHATLNNFYILVAQLTGNRGNQTIPNASPLVFFCRKINYRII